MDYYFSVHPQRRAADAGGYEEVLPQPNDLLTSVCEILEINTTVPGRVLPYPIRMCLEVFSKPKLEYQSDGITPASAKDKFIQNWRNLIIMYALNLGGLKTIPFDDSIIKQLLERIVGKIPLSSVVNNDNGDANWTNIGAIVLNHNENTPGGDNVIGSTNPHLLVVPNEDFETIMKDTIATLPDLRTNPEKSFLVAVWCRSLMVDGSTDQFQSLLLNFYNDLKRYVCDGNDKAMSHFDIETNKVKKSRTPNYDGALDPVKCDNVVEIIGKIERAKTREKIEEIFNALFESKQPKRDANGTSNENDDSVERIRSRWFNSMALLALRDVRKLNIIIDGDRIELDEKVIGYKDTDILFSPVISENGNVVDETIDNQPFFEHEKILFAYWLHKITKPQICTNLVNKKIIELLNVSLVNEAHEKLDTLKSANFFEDYFKYSGSEIDALFKDMVFENKLILFKGIVSDLIENTLLKGNLYKIASETEVAERVLLPFQKGFADKLAENAKGYADEEPIANHFGLSTVNTKKINDLDYDVSFKFLKTSFNEFDITKRFGKKNIESQTDLSSLGIASIWPAEEIIDFKGYYLSYVCSNSNKQNILNIEVPDSESDNTLIASENETVGNDTYTLKVNCLDKFPRYLQFKKNDAKGVIMCLPRKSHLSNTVMPEVTIAVDFGTSNSLLYLEIRGIGTPMQLTLEWSKVDGLWLTKEPDYADATARLFSQSPWSQNVKREIIPSVYTRFANCYNASRRDPHLDGVLLPISDSTLRSKKTVITKSPNVVTDPKMQKGQPNEILFKQMLFSAYNLAATKIGGKPSNVLVRFSYPKALDSDQKEQMRLAWTMACNKLSDITNHKNREEGNNNESAIKLLGFTESYCAGISGEYRNAHLGDGVIVLDIGGGTTDIAVVQENEDRTPVIKAEGSHKFGARQVLRGAFLFSNAALLGGPLLKLAFDFINRNRNIADEFTDLFESNGIDSNADFYTVKEQLINSSEEAGLLFSSAVGLEKVERSDLGKQDESAKVFNLEVALSAFSDALEKIGPQSNVFSKTLGQELVKRMKDNDKTRLPFLKINLALSSLFFYLGSYLKELQEKNVNEYDSIRQVVLAGNGSRIVDWLLLPEGMNTQDYLGYFLKQGLKNEDLNFELLESDKRKHEVALGLLKAEETAATITYDNVEKNNDLSIPTQNSKKTNKNKTNEKNELNAEGYFIDFLHAFFQKSTENDMVLLFGENILSHIDTVDKMKKDIDFLKDIKMMLNFADTKRRDSLNSDTKSAPWLFALNLLSN